MFEKRYIEQWNRVQRWYSKVEELTLKPTNIELEHALDIIYAFYINCFSLRDWIQSSNTNSEISKKVEDIFKDSYGIECFSICAGIANGSKHLKPDRKRATYGKTSIITQSIKLYPPLIYLNSQNNISELKASYRWTILSGNKEFDIYDLARECIKEWKFFLNQNNLI
jgi:hypothetical protein